MQALPRGNARTYDVCFSVNGGHLLHKLDQGVALGDAGLAGTTADRATEMLLESIVAVNLWSAGQSPTVDQCGVTFADGSVLWGTAGAALYTQVFRAFVAQGVLGVLLLLASAFA